MRYITPTGGTSVGPNSEKRIHHPSSYLPILDFGRYSETVSLYMVSIFVILLQLVKIFPAIGQYVFLYP